MGIIIKNVIKSMLEKKLRTILIIFAVTISAALFYASVSVTDTLVDLYKSRILQTTGNAEVLVKANEDSPSIFFNSNHANQLSDKFEYCIKGINSYADYKLGIDKYDTICLYGMDLEDYKNLNGLTLLEQGDLEPFDSNNIIISKYTADLYNLHVNDIMEFKINGVRRKLQVSAISASTGLFVNESVMKYGVVPFNTLSKYVDSQNKPNILYIKGNNTVTTNELIDQLKNVYPKYDVTLPFSEQELKTQASTFSTPLMLTTVMICFMSIFIIYSTFKVILLEKMPVVGTFRSVGASKKMVYRVMLLESLFYGVIGGIIACLLGVVILYALTFIATPTEIRNAVGVKIHISYPMMGATFLLSNVICFISTFLPSLKVSRLPIKDIVLNTITFKQKSITFKSVLSIICICVAVILPNMELGKLTIIGVVLTIFCAIVGIINSLPMILLLSSKILNKLYSILFGNIGGIALKNISGDKSMLNSITLISLGVAILLMINTATSSMGNELLGAVSDTMIYDLAISMDKLDRKSVNSIRMENGVDDVYPYYQAVNINIKNKDDSVSMIDGVSSSDYSKFISINYLGDLDEAFKKLQDDRGIIITKILQKRYGVNVGDELILEMPQGDRTYKVVGFAETMMNAGGYALIGERYFKMDTGQQYFSNVYVNTNDEITPSDVKESLRKKFKDNNPNIQTLKEYEDGFRQGHAQMKSMLLGFTALALIIGIIGVVNNLIISFIERKRSIAVLKSIGMSKKQVSRMILIEAFSMGLIGSIVGIFGGTMLVNVVPMTLEAMKLAMPIRHMTELYSVFILSGIIMTIISSIIPASKSSKLNIIAAIKYE